jgi:hypothetical protein
MPKKADLMGLGLTPFLARRMATEPSAFTSSGASKASAAPLGGDQYFVYVNASNSGSGVLLPAVGGDNGALLGDDFIIHNLLSATIQVYGPTSSTIYFSGASASASAGVSIQPAFTATFWPATTSTWLGLASA